MRFPKTLVIVSLALLPLVAMARGQAQVPAPQDQRQHFHGGSAPAAVAPERDLPGVMNSESGRHAGHSHDVGPAGATYLLRFIDGMVQHPIGALRMSEFVFGIGKPGVGALAKAISPDQAQESKAMGQWREAWYPEAPTVPGALPSGGDPHRLDAWLLSSSSPSGGRSCSCAAGSRAEASTSRSTSPTFTVPPIEGVDVPS